VHDVSTAVAMCDQDQDLLKVATSTRVAKVQYWITILDYAVMYDTSDWPLGDKVNVQHAYGELSC